MYVQWNSASVAGREENDGDAVAAGRAGRDAIACYLRMRAVTSSCSSGWTADDSTRSTLRPRGHMAASNKRPTTAKARSAAARHDPCDRPDTCGGPGSGRR